VPLVRSCRRPCSMSAWGLLNPLGQIRSLTVTMLAYLAYVIEWLSGQASKPDATRSIGQTSRVRSQTHRLVILRRVKVIVFYALGFSTGNITHPPSPLSLLLPCYSKYVSTPSTYATPLPRSQVLGLSYRVTYFGRHFQQWQYDLTIYSI
jgi:hypothetical protein